MTRRVSMMAVLAASLCSTAALAQQPADPMAMIRNAAANQLGVLEFCATQGGDPAAIDAQRTLITHLPPATDTTATDAAEALGKQGSISANGTTLTLASVATAQKTTVDAMCKQISSTVLQASKALAQQGGAMAPGSTPAAPTH